MKGGVSQVHWIWPSPLGVSEWGGARVSSRVLNTDLASLALPHAVVDFPQTSYGHHLRGGQA